MNFLGENCFCSMRLLLYKAFSGTEPRVKSRTDCVNIFFYTTFIFVIRNLKNTNFLSRMM